MKIQTRKSEKFVRTLFENLPHYIKGTKPDRYKIGSIFWSRFAFELFTRISEAYEIKALGGADELGNSWPPLKRESIARRPLKKGDLTKAGLTKRASGTSIKDRQRGLLTPEQNKIWKQTFSGVLKKLILTHDVDTAKAIAAASAWAKVKKMGARTKLEALGGRNVPIMRLSDKIYNSLTPSSLGVKGFYRPRKDQLFEVSTDKISIGTKVDYARFHNETRPVIPENISPWITESFAIAQKAVAEHIENIL